MMNQKGKADPDSEEEQDDNFPPQKGSPEPEDSDDMGADEDNDDEAGGRADLGRYASKPQVQSKPPESDVDPDESQQASQVINENKESSMGLSKLGSRMGGSAMALAANDSYYRELQGFVDSALKTVANKIAEKKGLEFDSASAKITIAKLRDDIKKEEQTQKMVQKSIQQETELSKKREREVQELADLLNMLKEKVQLRGAETSDRVEDLQAAYNENKASLEEAKSNFEQAKEQLEEEREATRAELRRLEAEHIQVCDDYDAMKKRMGQVRMVEHECVRMLREKSRILSTLIAQETSSGKSSIHQDICKILKTPEKNSFMGSQRLAERANA